MAAKTVRTEHESDISLFQEFLEWRQLQKNASSSGGNLEEIPPCASDEGAGGEGSLTVDKYTTNDVSTLSVQGEDAANTSMPDKDKDAERVVHGQSSTTQLQSFTAEQYLSTDKLSEAKKIFRVCTHTSL
jgi:hypothetical protein